MVEWLMFTNEKQQYGYPFPIFMFPGTSSFWNKFHFMGLQIGVSKTINPFNETGNRVLNDRKEYKTETHRNEVITHVKMVFKSR